ncbi:MAG: class IV adenylate cyclase [Thermoanaerobaculia bacterium]
MTSGGARETLGHEEIELKLPCEDLETVLERLRERGGLQRAPLHFESNDLFDNPEGRLSGKGCTLRLRRAGEETLLTFKGPARFRNGVKVRQEREVRVSDAAETEAILQGLGLERRFHYEKRREEWELLGCLVALDQTPIGNFVEVEGDPPAIRRTVTALGLDFASAIPYSYAKLYALKRQKEPSLPEDMVFGDGKWEMGNGKHGDRTQED